MLCKKDVVFLPGLHIVNTGWTASNEKVILTGNCFFPFHFTRDKKRVRCSGARSKLKIGALSKIFSYLTEYLDLPGHCKYLLISSLRIKKNATFSKEASKNHKGTPRYSRKIVCLYKNTQYCEGAEFVLSVKFRTPQYPRQRDLFLTEHLSLSVCIRFQQNSFFSQLR